MNIVITGGSKGMGKAIAMRFAAANHHILLNARTESALRETALEIRHAHPDSTVQFCAADLSTREGVAILVHHIRSQSLKVDVLVNNAGIFLPGSVHNEPEGTLDTMIQTNLYSAYHLTRALLPQMMKHRQGHIFNMCSIASFQAYPNGGAYSISKFALSGFSKNLREEMKPHNIKVTAVYPGAVYTDSWSGSGLPESRFIRAEDVAELIFAASQLSPSACMEEIIIRPQEGDI
ncbi:MAG: SDR family oxidoreductase [Chitinophagaceae bacterium]|nr:SDR family oxidoreductase [Chitinophagaceae bacterium]